MHALLAVVMTQAALFQAAETPLLRPVPSRAQHVTGEGIGPDVYVLAPKRPTFIDVQGPATVRLTLHGMVKRHGKGDTVRVQVRAGRSPARIIAIGGTALTGVDVPKRPFFGLTEPKVVDFEVERGSQTVSVKLLAGAGVAMAVQLEPRDAAADEGEAEPTLVGKVGADTIAPDDPTFVVTAPQPPLLTLRGPAGDETFFAASSERDFTIDASGPGLMFFDFHAHRSKARLETLEPVVVGILLDDVLVQTVSIDRRDDGSYRAIGRDHGVSSRLTLQLSVPPGRHRVVLSLSDEAVLGASIRPRFEKLPTVRESVAVVEPPAVPEPPPAPPPPPEPPQQTVIAAAPATPAPTISPSVARFGLLGGAWFPTDVPTAGPAVQLEAVIEPATIIGIGLSAGFGWARYSASAAPVRSGDVDVDILSLPLTADVRLRAPLTRSISLVVGAGAGARLAWGRTKSSGGETTADVKARMMALALVSLNVRTGDGEWLLRGQYMPTVAQGDDERIYDSGAVAAYVGYAF